MTCKNIAIIGYGARGQIYADYASHFPEQMKVVAVCDLNETKRKWAKERHGADVYADYKQLIDHKYDLDLVVISTQDKEHKEHAIYALEGGYNLLLEKPIAVSKKDCMGIYKVAKKYNRQVYVCHVLRYSPFYSTIKDIIDSGEIGDVINIHASENVGYYHQSHSFVRGPWKNSKTSCPMILAKCCHDMDIIRYLMGKRCLSVNSYGERTYFNKDYKPKEATKYCSDCPLIENCTYSSKHIYLDKYFNPWLAGYFHTGELNKEEVAKSLYHTQYDECVFDTDNDVVDHQSTIIQFEDGRTATHTMTAFSKEIYRDIKVYGTKAELVGVMEDNVIEIRPFEGEVKKIDVKSNAPLGGHNGSDYFMMVELNKVLNGEEGKGISYLGVSLESHLMAFGAEKSRKSKGKTQKIPKL